MIRFIIPRIIYVSNISFTSVWRVISLEKEQDDRNLKYKARKGSLQRVKKYMVTRSIPCSSSFSIYPIPLLRAVSKEPCEWQIQTRRHSSNGCHWLILAYGLQDGEVGSQSQAYIQYGYDFSRPRSDTPLYHACREKNKHRNWITLRRTIGLHYYTLETSVRYNAGYL